MMLPIILHVHACVVCVCVCVCVCLSHVKENKTQKWRGGLPLMAI